MVWERADFQTDEMSAGWTYEMPPRPAGGRLSAQEQVELDARYVEQLAGKVAKAGKVAELFQL